MSLRARWYGWYVLGLLAVANFFHYGNRNVLFSLYQDLRAHFGVSNSELGLLGTAFMMAHALSSLPFGWAGDRFDRRRVLAVGLALWSTAGIASAMAQGLGSLLVSRALMGVGTAACVPVANALLCQVFAEGSKARVISIFNLGLFLGGAASFGIGVAFGYPVGVVIMAVPGLALALLVVRLDVPPRRVSGTVTTFKAFVRQARELMQVPTMRWVIPGAVLMAFAAGGYVAWSFEYMAKNKGLGTEKAFIVFGISLVGGLMGILTGGIVADRLQRRFVFGRLAAISMGMVATVPFALIWIYIDVGVPFYVASWLTMFFITWYHGPMAAVIDDLAKSDRATTAQAMVLFTMHFLGTAPSSWVVGELADIVGLREALLVPTAAVLAAALILVGGWRTVGADRAAARASNPTAQTL